MRDKIIRLVETGNLSLPELSKRCGICGEHLEAYLAGKIEITAGKANAIAKAYGMEWTLILAPVAKTVLKPGADVTVATHVKYGDGRIERIVSKKGIKEDGDLAKPSQGGFSVTTESGEVVTMWDAQLYFQEVQT